MYFYCFHITKKIFQIINFIFFLSKNNRFKSWKAGIGSRFYERLTWFKSSKAIIHPLYDKGILAHNIAILILERSPTLGQWLKPAKLPSNSFKNFPKENMFGLKSSFALLENGELPSLLQLEIKEVAMNEICFNHYPNLKSSLSGIFCVIEDDYYAETCGGDQGGPFQIDVDGEKILAGIKSVSYQGNDCYDERPSAYIRITYYRDWIQEQTNV